LTGLLLIAWSAQDELTTTDLLSKLISRQTMSSDAVLVSTNSLSVDHHHSKVNKMDDTFDSTYIIRKRCYNEFISDISRLALTSYTIPAFVKPDLYKMIDIDEDIAMAVVWKPETTVRQIKEFDRKWFLEKY
jgi:hypothetical protein